MGDYKYSVKIGENMSKAVGLALPVSRKESVMICQAVRGLPIIKAKKLLEDVVALKKPIKFTRYNADMGHKRGVMSGRFPVSACRQILMLMKSAEANAQGKGLSSANLIVRHASAQKGPTSYHYGRQRTKAKRTHIELVLEEKKQNLKEDSSANASKKVSISPKAPVSDSSNVSLSDSPKVSL